MESAPALGPHLIAAEVIEAMKSLSRTVGAAQDMRPNTQIFRIDDVRRGLRDRLSPPTRCKTHQCRMPELDGHEARLVAQVIAIELGPQ